MPNKTVKGIIDDVHIPASAAPDPRYVISLSDPNGNKLATIKSQAEPRHTLSRDPFPIKALKSFYGCEVSIQLEDYVDVADSGVPIYESSQICIIPPVAI